MYKIILHPLYSIFIIRIFLLNKKKAYIYIYIYKPERTKWLRITIKLDKDKEDKNIYELETMNGALCPATTIFITVST